MEMLKDKNQFKKIRAVIFDFDGTLAVLNIDFSLMRERIFDLMRCYGIGEETIREKYLLEIIDEVYQILWEKSSSHAEAFYQESHQILHKVEMKGSRGGEANSGNRGDLKKIEG